MSLVPTQNRLCLAWEGYAPRQQIYLPKTWKFWLREDKTSPTFEQLTRSSMRMPVLIYERVKIAQHLRFIRRYKQKLIFVGKLQVLGILLLGFTGFWYISGTKYHSIVVNGLLALMATAKLDDTMYQIIDWRPKKGQLLVYVTREFAK